MREDTELNRPSRMPQAADPSGQGNPDRERLIEELECTVAHYFADITDVCGYPYIQHCLYVAGKAGELAERYFGDREHVEMAFVTGLCHDVYENLERHEQQDVNGLLKQLYPDSGTYGAVRHWLDLLTHDPGKLTYAEYFERITHSRMASLIKAADAHHNGTLSRWKFRLPSMSVKEAGEIRKMCGEYEGRSRRLLELLDGSHFDEA
jgi:hypothetical protein